MLLYGGRNSLILSLRANLDGMSHGYEYSTYSRLKVLLLDVSEFRFREYLLFELIHFLKTLLFEFKGISYLKKGMFVLHSPNTLYFRCLIKQLIMTYLLHLHSRQTAIEKI